MFCSGLFTHTCGAVNHFRTHDVYQKVDADLDSMGFHFFFFLFYVYISTCSSPDPSDFLFYKTWECLIVGICFYKLEPSRSGSPAQFWCRIVWQKACLSCLFGSAVLSSLALRGCIKNQTSKKENGKNIKNYFLEPGQVFVSLSDLPPRFLFHFQFIWELQPREQVSSFYLSIFCWWVTQWIIWLRSFYFPLFTYHSSGVSWTPETAAGCSSFRK